MKTLKHFVFRLFVTFIVLTTICDWAIFAQSGIYVGGHFRRERSHTITDLKASGFKYVILFNINVETNGDLTTDGEMICTNGNYVFGNVEPNYVSDVTALKTGTTSINRVESCIGGWGNHSYANIKSLVNSQGTGTGSILYRNFKALKNAIASMDAIDNDDEETYDVNSSTSFHVMLADIGYKSTLAPYMNKSFWQSLATNVNNQRGGAVDRIYLQCYDGGAGNNPCDWNINNITMHTGGLSYGDLNAIVNQMTSAKNNCGSKGGFFWVYNDNNINLNDLASRVNNIFAGSCTPSTITSYLQINGGAWQNISTGSLAAGGKILLGPQPTDGTWNWTGPNNFTSSSREITIANIQTNQAGNYIGSYTNTSGCISKVTFSISVCIPSVITPYLQINGGAWQSTTSANLATGSNLILGPQPIDGTWKWTGPNSYTSSSREITISNIQPAQFGNYVGLYTNTSGCNSSVTFAIGQTKSAQISSNNDNAILGDIVIFPNPATDKVTIANVPANTIITVSNLSGQTILRTQSSDNKGDAIVDVSELKADTYLIKIGDSKTIKLLKK